jgi:serine/threonine protein kinase
MRRYKKKGGDVTPIGEGDFGCVVSDGIQSFCNAMKLEGVNVPSEGRMVTKVMKDKSAYDKDIETAKALVAIDPTQEYLLYPLKFCEAQLNEQLTKACKLTLGNTIYLTEMQYGGVSLEQLSKQGKQFTVEQSKKIYNDIKNGLYKLHANKRSHGDLHHGNVLVREDADGVRAFLIDFGKADIINKDLDDFATLILSTLASLTEPSDFREVIASIAEINRKRVITSLAGVGSPSDPPTDGRTNNDDSPPARRALNFKDDGDDSPPVKRALNFF